MGSAMGQRANFEESTLEKTFKEVILPESTMQTKRKWVGGKWIPNISQKF
jgi:hypothetical protein